MAEDQDQDQGQADNAGMNLNLNMNLTPAQAAVLLELRKVLMTVEQINTTLKKTISLVRDASAVAEAGGPSRAPSSTLTTVAGGAAGGGGNDGSGGGVAYLRQVGGLVQVLSEAIAQGKGVFGRALGVEEAVEAGGRGDGDRNLGHG